MAFLSATNPLDNPHDVGLSPSRIPRKVQWIGVALFVIGVIASAIFSLTEHWRRATFTLGACMLFLAALRMTCDSRVLGVLAVRSRRFDAAFTSLIGAAMLVLASTVDSLGS